MNHSLEDTIAAIASAPGEGALGIIRISGPETLAIADQIFRTKKHVLPSSFQSHHLYFGEVWDENELIDEATALVMKAPQSYTGENSFEIYGHGSPFVLKKILSLCIAKGARLAEPGEFTKRAFLNGRMDLSQAEAVIDLVQAKSELQRKYALRQLQGDFSKALSQIREILFNVMVEAEANIDFPDYVPEGVQPQTYAHMVQETHAKVQNMLQGAQIRKTVQEGFKIVLMGEPNVGKSSLLNALAEKELAIVTELPGTTRDAIHHETEFAGIPVHFIDTAGLRDPENIVEEKGIKITQKKYEEADLILWILDVSSKNSDFQKFNNFINNGKECIIIANKIDISPTFNIKNIKITSKSPILKTSAIDGNGIQELKKAIETWVIRHSDHLETQYLLNQRQEKILQNVSELLTSAQKAFEENLGDDFIASDLRTAIQKMDEILGRSVNEEMIHAIFAKFCIGK